MKSYAAERIEESLKASIELAAATYPDPKEARYYLSSFADSATWAATPYDGQGEADAGKTLGPVYLTNVRKVPLSEIDRHSAEKVVTGYLASHYRAPELDRVLVRLLVRCEYLAYVNSQLAPGALGAQPLRALRPIQMLFLNFALNALFLGLFGYGFWALATYTPVPDGWIGWVLGAMGAWIVFATVWQIVVLPRDWIRNKTARTKALELINVMRDADQSIPETGAISVARVRQMVDKAADAGTVWPQPVYPLLEDIAGRTSTF